MPEGDYRRPPQLWEQKIANLVAVNTVGSVSGGGTTEVGGDLPPGDGGPAPDPDPVAPTPVAFLPPSTPTVAGTVQGVRVTWDGLNNAGELYPPDAYVEVHVSTSSGFTPSSSTLRGRLLGAGMFTVFGLTAGTTYYARLVGVDAYGNTTSPSTQASSSTGLTTSGDYGTATIDAGAVSFNARTIGGITTTVGSTTPSSPVTGDIWLDSSSGAIVHKRYNGSSWVTQAWGSDSLSANCITATQIAAGAVTAGAIAAGSITTAKLDASAVTADKIAASAITADKISAGAITSTKLSSDAIDGKTITGSVIRTSAGSSRVVLADSFVDILTFYFGGSAQASMYGFSGGVAVSGNVSILNGLDVSGNVQSDALSSATATAVPNLRAGTDGVIIKTSHVNSAQRFKQDIASLNDTVLRGVDAERVGKDHTVDPYSVLEIAPVQFTRVADGATRTGFIAEDVEAKFPTCVDYDEQGVIEGVDVRGIVAALLVIVKDQQQRIAALEEKVQG